MNMEPVNHPIFEGKSFETFNFIFGNSTSGPPTII